MNKNYNILSILQHLIAIALLYLGIEYTNIYALLIFFVFWILSNYFVANKKTDTKFDWNNFEIKTASFNFLTMLLTYPTYPLFLIAGLGIMFNSTPLGVVFFVVWIGGYFLQTKFIRKILFEQPPSIT
jgi:hypothetical protein